MKDWEGKIIHVNYVEIRIDNYQIEGAYVSNKFLSNAGMNNEWGKVYRLYVKLVHDFAKKYGFPTYEIVFEKNQLRPIDLSSI